MRISDWSSDVCSSDLRAVGDTDQRAIGDRGVRVEDVLDLARIDVLATADDDILGAIDDEAETLVIDPRDIAGAHRSEEHTSELQSLMRISYAVFCLKQKKKINTQAPRNQRLTTITHT